MAPGRVETEEIYDYIVCGGGTSGSVVAGRLAEDLTETILVIEAGQDNAFLENTQMAGGWSKNFDSDADWNIETVPMNGVHGRTVKTSRGRFLGGSSGCNGTLCIRGTRADYDDWGLEGWSGDEMFCMMQKGIRTTGADFITKDYLRDNITIKTEHIVDKVILEGSGDDLRATGVQIIAKDGTVSIARARCEVVVSGGSYCSPTILMRSGLGPRSDLKALNIPCKVDLPGVAQNLMDHLIVFVFYETEVPGLTTDHLVYHGDGLASTYQLWKEKKTGFLSTFPFGAFAYARLDDRLKDEPLWCDSPHEPGRDPMGLTKDQPNIEFFHTECYGGPKQFNQYPIDGKHTFAMISELFSPQSRGSVKLKSADPHELPIVDHNYLADPLDVLVLSEAVRFGNEVIVNGQGTKDVVRGSWPADLTHHAYTKREEWVDYVRDNATTCYHPGGTCRMGTDDDPLAVLDEKLRVRGVKRLRVADVSVMPKLNLGHTQMPAYGIGEKAAILLRST